MKTIVKQGDTLCRIVKLTYRLTGVPVSLTGCTAYSEMRTFPGGRLTATPTISISSDDGKITVLFSKEQTAALDEGSYGFDIRLEKDNERKTIYTEKICIVKPYTERTENTENEAE